MGFLKLFFFSFERIEYLFSSEKLPTGLRRLVENL